MYLPYSLHSFRSLEMSGISTSAALVSSFVGCLAGWLRWSHGIKAGRLTSPGYWQRFQYLLLLSVFCFCFCFFFSSSSSSSSSFLFLLVFFYPSSSHTRAESQPSMRRPHARHLTVSIGPQGCFIALLNLARLDKIYINLVVYRLFVE